MNITLICEHCKKEFIVPFKQRNKKYCNQTCYIDAGIKGKRKQTHLYEIRNCLVCNKEFEIRKKQQNKICSDDCRKIWGKEHKDERVEKSIKSSIEKNNGKYFFQTKEFKEKSQKTMMERYGVSTPMKNKSSVDKIKASHHKKHLPKLLNKLEINNIKLIDEYISNKDGSTSKPYSFLCLKCNNTFSSTLLGVGKIPICRKCYPIIKNSTIEHIVRDLINEKNIYHIDDDRKILEGKEIDILLPNNNIGFEINGNYWHSEIAGGKDSKYHIDKTIGCNKNNIMLIHIFEDEIKLKPDIVKSRINNLLGLITEKIAARKCIIKDVDKLTATQFLIDNHIQGSSVDKHRIGLYYNNELVSIMTLGKKRKVLGSSNAINEFELLRFCNKINVNIVGGFSKLLKHFIKTYNPKKIITYADIRWSGYNPENTVYLKNGFTFIGNTPPNYWYVKIYEWLNRFHRFNFRKDVLVKEGYSADMTEWDIMKIKGYDRIWDCGSMKFELNITC